MKHLFSAFCCAGFMIFSSSAFAWDGFDADSIDLVEIQTEIIPARGETIDIKNRDSGVTNPGIVQSLKQNRSTIEIVVLYPDNTLHTLVMEGR